MVVQQAQIEWSMWQAILKTKTTSVSKDYILQQFEKSNHAIVQRTFRCYQSMIGAMSGEQHEGLITDFSSFSKEDKKTIAYWIGNRLLLGSAKASEVKDLLKTIGLSDENYPYAFLAHYQIDFEGNAKVDQEILIPTAESEENYQGIVEPGDLLFKRMPEDGTRPPNMTDARWLFNQVIMLAQRTIKCVIRIFANSSRGLSANPCTVHVNFAMEDGPYTCLADLTQKKVVDCFKAANPQDCGLFQRGRGIRRGDWQVFRLPPPIARKVDQCAQHLFLTGHQEDRVGIGMDFLGAFLAIFRSTSFGSKAIATALKAVAFLHYQKQDMKPNKVTCTGLTTMCIQAAFFKQILQQLTQSQQDQLSPKENEKGIDWLQDVLDPKSARNSIFQQHILPVLSQQPLSAVDANHVSPMRLEAFAQQQIDYFVASEVASRNFLLTTSGKTSTLVVEDESSLKVFGRILI